MATWIQYSNIKQLIEHYFNLKDKEKYDEFIRELAEILEI